MKWILDGHLNIPKEGKFGFAEWEALYETAMQTCDNAGDTEELAFSRESHSVTVT